MIAAPIPSDDEQRLRALAELGVLDTPREERFDRVTRMCRRLFGVPMAFVNLVDRERVFAKSASGVERGDAPRSSSFCGHAILGTAGLVIEDTDDDPRFRDNPHVTGEPRLRFYAGMPLEAPGGELVGTLCIADVAPRVLGEADRALLRDLAVWVQKELNVAEELDRAAQVQRAMLPVRRLDAPGWDVAGACRPSREVGGDFFDWHRSPAGPVVALGDVMGKGMAAAIVMASVRAALRAGTRAADLAAGVRDAAESLHDDLAATATFTTVVVARLAADGELALVDAGHGHAALIRAAGGVQEQTDGGLPLGIARDERYAVAPLRLDVGDMLLLHSDGLLELPGGPASTAAAAARVAGCASADEAVARLIAACAGQRLADDVTVVAIARRR